MSPPLNEKLKKTDTSKLSPITTQHKTLTKYSREEVAKHSTVDDIWIIIDNKVYDVTDWMGKHPGGSRIIEVQGGCDVTEPYLINHTAEVQLRKNPYLIGYIKDEEQKHLSPLAKDIFRFKERLIEAGMYKSTAWFYVKRLAIPVFLFTIGWYGMFQGTLLGIVVASFAMGLFTQQMALFGHDCGHNSVTMDQQTDWLIASCLSSMIGLSVTWWKINHHTHHAVTNSVEHDPDIQHLPFISVSKEQLGQAYWSKYYRKWFNFDAAAKFLISKQHFFMLIIFAFSRFNLYAHCFKTLFFEENLPLKFRVVELIGFTINFSGMGYWVSLAGSWERMLFAFFLSHAVAGITLSIPIGISHWVSPVVHDHPGDTNPCWFRHQLTTTIDVDCYPINDWFFGGLQFQTIHHLMPRLPRCRLRESCKELEEILKEHGIVYPKMSFYNMFKTMYITFRNVAHEAAGMPTTTIPKLKST